MVAFPKPPNIRLQGIQASIPAGYVLGRVDAGTGDVQLIKITDILAMGGGGSGGAAFPYHQVLIRQRLGEVTQAAEAMRPVRASIVQLLGQVSQAALGHVPTRAGIAQTLGEVTQAAEATRTAAAAPSYSNTGGTGDRRSIIAILAAPFPGSGGTPTVAAETLIDGSFANSYYWNSFQSLVLEFDFGSPKVINEAKWYQDSGGSHGDVKWQGSPDNAAWTDIGSSFTLGGVTVQTQTELNGNTTAYRYYRMIQVSGSTSNGPYLQEIEFSIS